jgi:hypothetical protein
VCTGKAGTVVRHLGPGRVRVPSLPLVVAILEDGTEQPGVRIAWATEVVGVAGYENVPFEVARIVDVRPDPAPEDEPDDDAPF